MELRLINFILESITVCAMCVHGSCGLNHFYDSDIPVLVPYSSSGYDFNITVQPPEISQLPVNTQRQVYIICSHILPPLENTTATNLTYVASVVSENTNVAIATAQQYGSANDNKTAELTFQVQLNKVNTFEVHAIQVGRVTMMIKVSKGEEYRPSGKLSKTVSIIEYHVSVIRQMRTADLVFDAVMAAVAMLNIFSVGCCTDWESLRTHLRHPSALSIASCCQFIIMPMVS